MSNDLIQVIQFTGELTDQFVEFFDNAAMARLLDVNYQPYLHIYLTGDTLDISVNNLKNYKFNGEILKVCINDWVIKNINGKCFVVGNATYQLVYQYFLQEFELKQQEKNDYYRRYSEHPFR